VVDIPLDEIVERDGRIVDGEAYLPGYHIHLLK
jgi:hypothetical protein